MQTKTWYQVTSPDGYICLELAYTAQEACRRASESRPGYAPEAACRAVPYITDSARRACHTGREQAKERLE